MFLVTTPLLAKWENTDGWEMPKMLFPDHSFLVFPAETAKKKGTGCQSVSEGNSTPGRILMGPSHSFPPGLHFHQQGRKYNTTLQAFDTEVWGSQSDLYYTHVNQGLLVPQSRWHFTAAVLIRPQISPSLTCILKGDGRCLDYNSMPFPLHVWLGQLLKERKKKFWGQRGGLCWYSSWSRSFPY